MLFVRFLFFMLLLGFVHVVCKVCFLCVKVFSCVVTWSMCGSREDGHPLIKECQGDFNIGIVYMAQQNKVTYNVGKVYMVQQNDQHTIMCPKLVSSAFGGG